MKIAHQLTIALTALGLAFAGTACGADDGTDVRTIGSETAVSGSGSGSGSSSGVAAAEAACAPVGEDLDPDTTVAIDLVDYGFDPATLEAPAGVVRFETTNVGDEAHELAFLPGGGDVPFADGVPDEDALVEMGAFELEGYGPGQDCSATYDLSPGAYTIFCIIERADGTTHYELGMRGTVTITG